MKSVMKAVVVIGVSTLASPAAYAACTVTSPGIGFNSNYVETDCASTSATNAAIAGLQGLTNTNTGDIATLQGNVGTLQGTVDSHTTQIGQNTSDIGTLQTTKADKSYVDSQNDAQDTVIAEHTATLADHENRITTNTAGIAATNTRLNSFNGTGETVETWATGVDNTLADHGARIGTAETNISALYGLYGAQQGQINNLNSRMDKAYAGIAMATAFESPQVDPGKRFGLSLNWGEFEGVSAFSSSAKLRFNDNWAATGGAAVSQGGQIAAKVGIQTQW